MKLLTKILQSMSLKKKKNDDLYGQLKIISDNIEDIRANHIKLNKKLVILTNSYYHITKDIAALTEILQKAALESQQSFDEDEKDKEIIYH